VSKRMPMAAPPNVRMTEAEYLAFDRASDVKHEYYRGEIFAMSGASRKHNVISGNTYASLHAQLRGRPCEKYQAEMRVRVARTRLYTYPDITVVCGEPHFADNEFDTLLNPTLLVEVLSPSTERYDRGRKFQHYREIDSLREYVLIAQDQPRIERFLRQDDGTWLLSDASGLEGRIELASIGCTLALADVYEQVTFEAEDEPENGEL
jgi:Uma2 family endonuclease